MKLKPITLAISLSALLASAAQAQNVADTERAIATQNKAAASGMVIGAIAGGPAGAFFGSILGGEVVARVINTNTRAKTLAVKLTDLQQLRETERQELEANIQALNQDLDKLLAIQMNQPKTQSLPVQFKTASSRVEPQYRESLRQIAGVLNRNKDASITLAGFADRRGDDSYNQRLSEDRVAAVRQFLVKQGVHQSQILGVAFGETQPLQPQESLEDNFFDRRVVIELNLDLDAQLATR